MDSGRSIPDVDWGELLCSDEDVEFAVLFGSRADRSSRPTSDIDIAIKFVDGCRSGDRFRKLCALSGGVQRPGLPFVDLSDIESLPLEVRHRAVRGTVLCGDKVSFREFRSETEQAYQDRRSEIDARQESVIRRIAEEGLHG